MKKHLKFTLSISLITIVLFSFTDKWSAKNKEILQDIITYGKLYRQEKLYIQTDKPVYFSGEKVWLSFFLTEVTTNQPNQSESVIHLELINPSGKQVLKNLYKIENGRSKGQLSLSKNLPTGIYTIVGYTNWMRNAGSAFYFQKEITVVNDNNKEKSTTQNKESNIKENSTNNINPNQNQSTVKQIDNIIVNFYPEGGNLIDGIESKVAYEVTDSQGNPLQFLGNVVDDNDDVVSSLVPTWQGKGFFVMTPDATKHYKAVINDKGSFELPKIEQEGFHLSLKSGFNTDDVILQISHTSKTTPQEFFLLVMQDQNPMSAIQDTLITGEKKIRLNKKDFNTGVIQITLFDNNKTPQCERLFFINHYNFTNIEIEPDKATYNPREKVSLNISSFNSSGQPVSGSFALSVTDASRIDDQFYQPMDFISYNTFKSDLPNFKGDASFIYKQTQTNEYLTDLIMLTNGWRRYKWTEIINKTLKLPKYLEEPGLYLKGKVFGKNSKPVGPGVKVSMYFKDLDRGDRYYVETDSASEFTFLIDDFTDSLVTNVSTRTEKDKMRDYSFEVESNTEPRAYDLKAKKQLSDQTVTEKLSNLASGSDVVKDLSSLSRNQLSAELVRAIDNSFFVDTANVNLEEVSVFGNKVRNVKDVMVSAYGAPTNSIGQKQIEAIAEEKTWNSGIISVIENALPGLEVYTTNSDTDDMSNGYYVQFLPRGKQRHRFFVYVDGRMVGATDDKGLLRSMTSVYIIDDLLSLGVEEVKSVDLVFPQQGSKKFEIKEENVNDLYSESDQSLSFDNTNVIPTDNLNSETESTEELPTTVTNSETFVDPLKELKENPMFYTSPEAILSIYTKTGNGLFSRSDDKGRLKFYLKGYTQVKEFYSPDYSDSKIKVNQDKRTTLYWNPLVTTDISGKAKVEFYNSDLTELFRADAVGFSNSGMAGNARITFGQEKPKSVGGKNQTDASEPIQPIEEINNWDDPSKVRFKAVLSDGKPAKHAIVIVPSQKWGTTTDINGDFYIDNDTITESDSLFITYPLGESASIVRSTLVNYETPIKLNSVITTQDSNVDAEKTFKDALKDKYKTKLHDVEYANCVYRQEIFRNNEMIHLFDLSLHLRLPNIKDLFPGIAPDPQVGRVFKIENYEANAEFTPYNNSLFKVQIMDPFLQELTFMDLAYMKYFDFEYLGTEKYQNRDVYKIAFDQSDDCDWVLSKGYALIDKETMGFAYISWGVSPKASKYIVPDMYILGGSEYNDFKLETDENQAFFVFIDGVWKFKAGMQNVEFLQNKSENSYRREMVLTDYLGTKLKGFKPTSIEKMDSRLILVKEPKYLPHYWRDAWFLPTNDIIHKNASYLHEIMFLSNPKKK